MKKAFYFLTILSLFLMSCSNKGKIKVIHTNFSEEIGQLQNLVFTFNKDIAPDSLLFKWDSTTYISFEPHVAGNFRWNTTNELVFSPISGFAPNTDYKASVTKQITHVMGKRMKLEKETFEFHTAYLKLENSRAFWALEKESEQSVVLKVSLRFNYPINPLDLKDLLNINVDNKVSEFKIVTKDNNNVIDLSLPEPKVDISQTTPVHISIKPGLQCIGSKRVTESELEAMAEIPPKDQLQITEITANLEEGEGSISILTTQPVVNKDLKNIITISPKVNFTTELLPSGILLKGDFEEGETYTVTVSKQLQGVFGKTLEESYSQSVTFGVLEPHISFKEQSSVYLSSEGEKNIAINIVSVPKVKLTIFKVFENNILHYLREGKDWDYYYDEEDQWHDIYQYPFNAHFGKIILEKEVETKSLTKKGNARLLNINLDEINYSDHLKGIYVVKVESPDKRWLQASQLISISDIGMIVKRGKNKIYVFANSIKNAAPISGAEIKFISQNNQEIFSATTNNKGVAVLEDIETQMKDFSLSMITAHYANDFNFLNLNNNRIETSRFDVGGKRMAHLDYDVFVYGERDLYRPGDTVYFNTVVRTPDWETVSDLPLKMKVLLPNGKQYLNFIKNTNKYGAVENFFHIPADMMTGTYSFEVYSGNDVLLQSSNFSIEEFMPDRIKVISELNNKTYKPGEDLTVNITATNLFGPPAPDRNVETELKLTRKYLYVKELPQFTFGIKTKSNIYFRDQVQTTTTDDEGKAEINYDLPNYKNIGIIDGKVYTTVFDETGRPVNKISAFEIHTQDIFYGIQNFDYWVNTRQPVKIHFVAIDKDHKIQNNVKAKVEIKRYYWETHLVRSGRRLRYNSQKREQIVYSKVITLSGKETNISFKPTFSGQYEVKIMKDDNSDGYVYREFYAYGWGDTDYSSFEVSKDGEITIETDKESYQPGDKADILFKAPFSGKILVTVEKDDILDYYYLETDNKAASLKLPISEEHLPNIYITATAYRELENDQLPLTVAHGFTNINIEKKSNKIDVAITAVEKSRSKTKQTIKVKSAPNAEVTIAVVDEGILQIKGYKTPDPYAFFYAKRALGVTSYDLYKYLYPEITLSSSFGGDGGYDLSKRINPMTNKRVKLVSFWSGHLKANNRGECQFEIDIPKFSGALRVMAVAYKDKTFGSSEHEIKIADPVVISTALPRFLSPGDKASMPITLTNTTDKKTKAVIQITTKGPVKIEGSQTKTISLNANSENRAEYILVADADIGEAEIQVEVNALNEKFEDKTDITVRPPTGLDKRTDAGTLLAGNFKSFKVETDFIQSTSASKLILSKSPIAEFLKDIKYLVRYPYGCLEQTVSAAFPQMYLSSLSEALNKGNKDLSFEANYNVQQAVHKVQSLQRYDGSFYYWPDYRNTNWWASVYATHFLIEARKAGFDVVDDQIDLALKFLNQRVKDKAQDKWYYYDNDYNLSYKTIAARETFYSLFVLALNGKENKSIMNYYKNNLEWLSTDSRYLLAGAYALIGDMNSYHKIIPVNWDNNYRSYRSFGGSFYSYIRDKSIALYALMESNPTDKQVPLLTKHLSEEMKKTRWMSTQERAFALIALGRVAKKAKESDIKATIYVDGEKSGTFDNKDKTFTTNFNNKKVKIEASGSGNLYYFYEVEGISASGTYPEEDNFIQVRKNFYTRFGNRITNNEFAQNDLIVIELVFKSLDGNSVENVAITDLLPACFEIENPRITPERDMKWIDDIRGKITPDYLDIRDDRINIFTTVNRYEQRYFYMVRAVSPGTYKMGPVMGDAMYNGEYHSYWGARDVTVK